MRGSYLVQIWGVFPLIWNRSPFKLEKALKIPKLYDNIIIIIIMIRVIEKKYEGYGGI